MPFGTCDPASRGETYNEFALRIPFLDGSGFVLVDCRYDWDGTSVKPNCNGPVIYLQTQNTGTSPAWALLPDKKRGNPWYQIDPQTNVTVTARGQLANLGLSNAIDVRSVRLSFVNPAA